MDSCTSELAQHLDACTCTESESSDYWRLPQPNYSRSVCDKPSRGEFVARTVLL